MRIFYTTIIAFFMSLLTAGLVSAQMTDRSCCKDEQVGAAMNMATCRCAHMATSQGQTEEVLADMTEDMPGATDCCAMAACRGSLVPSKVAIYSPISYVAFSAMVQLASIYQPMPATLLGAHRTGPPPPRLPSPPVYIQHCSFLI